MNPLCRLEANLKIRCVAYFHPLYKLKIIHVHYCFYCYSSYIFKNVVFFCSCYIIKTLCLMLKRQATVYLGLFISISLEALKKVIIYRPESIRWYSEIVMWLSKSLWKQKFNIRKRIVNNVKKTMWKVLININKLICGIAEIIQPYRKQNEQTLLIFALEYKYCLLNDTLCYL